MIKFGYYPDLDKSVSFDKLCERIYREENNLKAIQSYLSGKILAKSISQDEFIKTFFPESFSTFFCSNLKNFNKSGFINATAETRIRQGVAYHRPLDKLPFRAFAVAFWNGKIALNKQSNEYLPPECIDSESAKKNMLSFIAETTDNVKKFFSNTPYDKEKFKADLRTFSEDFLIFKNYDYVIEKCSNISEVRRDEKEIDILKNAFNIFTPQEAFARLLITVALGALLFPQRDKNTGDFTFKPIANLDPQLALNVLWFTDINGAPLPLLDLPENFEVASETAEIEDDGLEEDLKIISMANIRLALGDNKAAFSLLDQTFNHNFDEKKAARSPEYRKGMLSLAECYYYQKGCSLTKDSCYRMVDVILKNYRACCNEEGSYYLYKFYKSVRNPGTIELLEESVKAGNEKAIIDLAEAYFSGDVVLGCEKDLGKAFNLLETSIKNGNIKNALGYCYYFMGKICADDNSLGNGEFWLKKAMLNGYHGAADLFNKAKKERKKAEKKLEGISFYFTNSSDKANIYFNESIVIPEDTCKLSDDERFEAFRSSLVSGEKCNFVAAFLSDDEEKNVFDCIKLINRLDALNTELAADEAKAKKEAIKGCSGVIDEVLGTLGEFEDDDAKAIIEKLNGIKSAVKSDENIKLGQNIVFRQIISKTETLFKNSGKSCEAIKSRLVEIKDLFALPTITKKLIESVRIVVKADSEFATSIINSELSLLNDNLYFRIKIADYALSAAHQLISQRPVFAPCLASKDEKANVVVFGSGKVVEKIVTETLACTTMGNKFSPSVTVIDDNIENIERTIQSTCPALYNDSEEAFSLQKPLFLPCPLNSPELYRYVSGKSAGHGSEALDSALRKGNYFVVATENDKFNLEFAKKLRGWLLMTENRFERLPVIAVLIKNETTAGAAEYLEVGGHSAGSSWYNNYNLFCFGQERRMYSAAELIENANDKRAEYIHCSYSFVSSGDNNSPFDSDSVHESLVSFYNNYYNHDSSLCTAISLPYRLFAEGLYIEDGIESYENEENSDILAGFAEMLITDKDSIDKLAEAEHNRWIMFMASRGWQRATKEQLINYKRRGVPKQQCFICKLHPYLAEWSELDNIHKELLSATKDIFEESKLNCPKEYNKDSYLRTPEFLNKYDLFKEFSSVNENRGAENEDVFETGTEADALRVKQKEWPTGSGRTGRTV